jgi:mannose-1-phosphate guanylyltransferase/mannose-6-phosphate isomerase
MIPVILSGGSGTRLWPVSRASYPKQFCELYDQSFLDNTIERLKSLGDVHILTTKTMESLTQRAVKRVGLHPENVLLEPMSKNTAPAMALLCHTLQMRGLADEIVGVFPSDHLISDKQAFRHAVQLATQVAAQGYVTTIGILPSSAATGYGYIEVADEVLGKEGALRALRVKGFREKPNAATAETYVHSGRHFWNAGMFVFRVSQMIQLFQEFQPQMWSKISQITADMSNAQYNFAMVESISIDYAIMEKLKSQACIPCEMGWSDVGSWDEVARLAEEESPIHSRSSAQVFNQGSENNFVFTVQGKVVGLVGVSDLMVVDTPDALLVVKKGASQQVKELVDTMKVANLPEATEHPFETRPWGGFQVIADAQDFKTKRITVDPGAQLSYQSHTRRSEHWVVVSGQAEVVLNDQTIKLQAGQSVVIPTGSKHRMRNVGSTPLVFIETQTGSYFGEDDIVRYLDDYNRVTP